MWTETIHTSHRLGSGCVWPAGLHSSALLCDPASSSSHIVRTAGWPCCMPPAAGLWQHGAQQAAHCVLDKPYNTFRLQHCTHRWISG